MPKKKEKLEIGCKKLEHGISRMISNIDSMDLDVNKTCVVAIGRGGFVPAQYLAYALDIIDIHSVQSILYDSKDKQTKTQRISGVYNIPFEDYDNIIVVDDMVDSSTTMLNVVTILEEAADDALGVYTERRPTFIPAVIYTHKKKKFMKKHDIIYGVKIKKVNGVRPWLVFPWDSLTPVIDEDIGNAG